MAVFSFLPVPRAGFDLVNPEGYTAFSLFPHLVIVPHPCVEECLSKIALEQLPTSYDLAADSAR
jgi:hypothetical protein